MTARITMNRLLEEIQAVSKRAEDIKNIFDLHVQRESDRDLLVAEHDKMLVRGNGKPSMAEDLRNVMAFQDSQRKWLSIIGVAFVGQFVVLFVSLAVVIIQAMPILSRLVAEAPQLAK